ncbi:MAG: hypothetical protein DRJ50_13470 [Actinobacteria bacterium]|nr:MAG: hypothetical protein DRJ50_13470 [Actinomycetota bacterium]
MDHAEDRRPGPAWGRIVLLVVMAWWTLRLATGTGWIFLDYVNLAFHEAGHVFLSFAGSTVHYLGGTIGQLLVPGLLVAYFLLRRQQPYASAFCLWWFGQNLINISIYMADARELALPLVGGGDHDWNELFFRFDLLAEPSVERVSGLTFALGMLVMLLGLLWSVYFVLPEATRTAIRDRVNDRSKGRACAGV